MVAVRVCKGVIPLFKETLLKKEAKIGLKVNY